MMFEENPFFISSSGGEIEDEMGDILAREISDKIRSALMHKFATLQSKKDFEGSFEPGRLGAFMRDQNVSLSMKYSHIAFTTWMLLRANIDYDATKKAKLTQFVRDMYAENIQLNLSIQPEHVMIEIGHMTPFFSAHVSTL